MDDPELMEVGHTSHDIGELKVVHKQEGKLRATPRGLTSCKRFPFGFDRAYCVKFPLPIHSERTRK